MALDSAVVRRDDDWPTHNQIQPLHQSLCDGVESTEAPQDHFIVRDGVEFAGTHVIIDLWGATGIDNLARMETALREAVEVCGATFLHFHLHHFTPNHGISGVVVLAESHISVHTWPERGFAAFDVFMCGDAKPELAADVLKKYFAPNRVDVTELRRGTVGNIDGE